MGRKQTVVTVRMSVFQANALYEIAGEVMRHPDVVAGTVEYMEDRELAKRTIDGAMAAYNEIGFLAAMANAHNSRK